jgi:enhancing lycopene biosynthesis protein 2
MSKSAPHQLDAADLAQVIGGAANVRADGSSSTDSQIMAMMNTLSQAMQNLQKPQDNSMMMAMLPMLMDKQSA